MGHTEEQRMFVIRELVRVGWQLKGDTVTSPSGEIWFGRSHFKDCGPEEFKEIIWNRGKRIETAKFEGWEDFSNEHYQLCDAIEKLQAQL